MVLPDWSLFYLPIKDYYSLVMTVVLYQVGDFLEPFLGAL